jgi:PAS domain S-box-containing protein
MKNWLDTIIDSSYDGLWICDHEGKVIRINKASEKINQVKAEDIIGKNMSELVTEGLFDKSVSSEVLKRKTSVTMLQQIKGGKRILVTGNPILNEKGEITFVVTNERDITELDKLRNQLQEVQALAKGYSSKLAELEMKGVDLPNIIFRSEEMGRIIEMTLRVAKVDSTIILLGESGVGKGMIAKLIHKHSERNNGPFIRVDCAGIPDTLVESELFGYEKGAFTGAKSEGKPGFFELAHKGTLFLDEIGEIPISSQSKLLRFLEDHEIIRVGGIEPKKIDVRIIAATNKDIEEMVTSNLFRKDLYYRLNVVPIFIPPLRERRDDIMPLIFHFLEKFNKEYQRKKSFSPEAMDALCRYDFFGNIRELANIIERLVVVAEKDRIETQDLPKLVIGYRAKEIPHSFLLEGISLKEALEKCESYFINRIIKKYGSQHEAAKILKVDQATISRKMKKYGISQDDVILHK